MSEKPSTAANRAPAKGFANSQRLADRVSQPSGNSTSDPMPAATELASEVDQPAAKGWKFWMVFPPLCIATLLMALESTVTSTALPMIAASLGSGDNYVWFLNGYLLTS
jgi:hypothetical protein